MRPMFWDLACNIVTTGLRAAAKDALPRSQRHAPVGCEDSSFISRLFRPKVGPTPAQYWRRAGFLRRALRGYNRVVAAGYPPDTVPHDAEWGARYFLVSHPDGHEPSFAWPLRC